MEEFEGVLFNLFTGFRISWLGNIYNICKDKSIVDKLSNKLYQEREMDDMAQFLNIYILQCKWALLFEQFGKLLIGITLGSIDLG